VYGKERATDEALIGSFSLQTAIDDDVTSGLTRLHQEMGTMLPDAAKSQVQYEKGFQLMHHLEDMVGEADLQKFLQEFVQKYAYKSATSKDFTDTFDAFIAE
jgi:leukotriene-A4 hydrolase